MSEYLKGDVLMLFIKDTSINSYRSIAYATEQSLSIESSAKVVRSHEHGYFSSSRQTPINWSISTNHLFTEKESNYFFSLLVNHTPVTVMFGISSNSYEEKKLGLKESGLDFWTPDSGYVGKAIITEFSINSDKGDNAGFTISLLGISSLKKVGSVPEDVPSLPARLPAALSFASSSVEEDYSAENVYSLPVLNNPAKVPIRYMVRPTGYARVYEGSNSSLNLVTTNSGEFEVVALFDGNDELETAQATLHVRIGEDGSVDTWTTQDVDVEPTPDVKKNPLLWFVNTSVTVAENDYMIYDIEELYNPYNLTGITYSSPNDNVTIDQQNKTVTVTGLGTYTIVASFDGDDTYNPTTTSYTLQVVESEEVDHRLNITWNISTAPISVSTYDDETYTLIPRSVSVTPSEFNDDIKVYVNDTLVTSDTYVLETAGTYVVRYVFDGNDYYYPSSTQYTVMYTQESRKLDIVWDIDTSSLNVETTDGQTYTLIPRTFNVTPSELKDDIKVYVNDTLVTSDSVILETSGAYVVKYVFEGNSEYNPSSTQYNVVYTQSTRENINWGIDTSDYQLSKAYLLYWYSSSSTNNGYTIEDTPDKSRISYRYPKNFPSSLTYEINIYDENRENIVGQIKNSSIVIPYDKFGPYKYVVEYKFEGNEQYYPSTTSYILDLTNQLKSPILLKNMFIERWEDENPYSFVASEHIYTQFIYTGTTYVLDIPSHMYNLDTDVFIYDDDDNLLPGTYSVDAEPNTDILEYGNAELTYNIIYPADDYFTIILQRPLLDNSNYIGLTWRSYNNGAGSTWPTVYYNLDDETDSSNNYVWKESTTKTLTINNRSVGEATRIRIKRHDKGNYSSTNTSPVVNIYSKGISYKCGGNIMSLRVGADIKNELPEDTTIMVVQLLQPYEFYRMFYYTDSYGSSGDLGLVDAYNLRLPYRRTDGFDIIAESVCQEMFKGCSNLVRGPKELNIGGKNAYKNMFRNCTSLTYAPRLLQENISTGMYYAMFYGCKNLSRLESMNLTVNDNSTNGATYNWLYGVASSGTFVRNDIATWTLRGASGVPNGWTQEDTYGIQYLTFEALEAGTFSFSLNSIDYSLDDGSTWNTLAAGDSTPTVAAGDKVLWRASGLTPTGTNYGGIGTFSATGKFNVYGNILSLVGGANFTSVTSIAKYQFCSLFRRNAKLWSSKNLVLPSFNNDESYIYFMSYCSILQDTPRISHIELKPSCFSRMFEQTSITETPVFSSAENAQSRCYQYMFYGCTRISKVHPLLHTTLALNCYIGMFINCRSIVDVTINATTLAQGCCNTMFQNCTSMVKSPTLWSSTLVTGCYENMFLGCTNLNEVHALFTTTPSDSYTKNWLNNVASTGTFYKSPSATWDSGLTRGASTVPEGWTITNKI